MSNEITNELIWEREWPARTSILVLAFAGYFDAASAATGAVDHLIEHTGATRLATIDGDAFFDVLKRLHTLEGKVPPVIIVTAHAQTKEVQEAAADPNVVLFLSKPINQNTLLAALHRVLKTKNPHPQSPKT